MNEAILVQSLSKKILAVMSAVDRVAKDKRNDFHKYDYASDEAVVSAVREALIKNRLIVYPRQTECRREGDITTLRVEYHIVDVDSGEQEIVPAYGQGQDKGDKGVYKAATGAEKYFLLKTFLIPTGDDPEATNGIAASTRSVAPTPSSEIGDAITTEEDPLPESISNQEPAHWPHPAEATKQKPGCISEKQSKRFYAIAKGANKTDKEIKDFLTAKIDSAHSMDIPWRRYEALCDEIKK